MVTSKNAALIAYELGEAPSTAKEASGPKVPVRRFVQLQAPPAQT